MPPKKDNKDKGGGKDKGKAAGGAKGGKADKEKEKTGTNTAIKVGEIILSKINFRETLILFFPFAGSISLFLVILLHYRPIQWPY